METSENKTLEIGKDYGCVFGLNAKKGQTLIYNGGVSFTGHQGDKTMTMDSQDTYDKVYKYINMSNKCGTWL